MSNGRWFRFYDEALNDPKVQRLPGDLFKAWANLLCLASKTDGQIASAADAAFALRISEDKARVIVAQLAGHGLLDPVTDGYFEPHNWPLRQFKSDVSNERVKRFREREKKRECNVTETVDATGPETEQNRTEDHGGDDPSAGLVGNEAIRVAEEIALIAGFPDPTHWPPGWCGAPMRMRALLDIGWQAELMIATARGVMTKKRDGPPQSLAYFEAPFAKAHAQLSAAVPKVNVIPPQEVTINESHRFSGNKPSGITAAIDTLIRRIDGESEAGSIPRQADSRLLSDGRRQ